MAASVTPGTGRTAWARNLAAPVRSFLNTESGGALVLLAATVLALLWANSPWSDSYESVWTTDLTFRLGSDAISMDIREWVNSGLMTFFFLVVGLEAKRELDLGTLRERRRVAIPVFASLLAMTFAVLTYIAFNGGGPGAHGWGAAMSTDTAFALGVVALVAPRATRLRVRLLTIVVVDDLADGDLDDESVPTGEGEGPPRVELWVVNVLDDPLRPDAEPAEATSQALRARAGRLHTSRDH
jgi:Na+/H+ antiporter NhaA